MSNNNLLVVLGIIMVVEVALAAGIIHVASDDGSDGGDDVYTLYIGMQDSETLRSTTRKSWTTPSTG